jgi:catechol 2,3-dioxygenase-like lactoylglutathione lyase family enzyme
MAASSGNVGRWVPNRARPTRPRLLVATFVAVLLGAASVPMLSSSIAGTSTDAVRLSGGIVSALSAAATSCSALTSARLAGQVMAATRHEPTAGAGVSGLSSTQWDIWKPWEGASPDDARASLLALAHLTCDLIGQVRVAAIPGDLWRLAVAAVRSSMAELRAAGRIPDAALPFVNRVDDCSAWYARQPGTAGRTSAPASAPTAGLAAGGRRRQPHPSFADDSGLVFNDAARMSGGRLDLTSALQQAGSAWSTAMIDTSMSFRPTFAILPVDIGKPPTRSPSWQDGDVERVLGIGGYFMRAADPVALGAWYRDCLGLDADENGLWRQEAGLTVFATFASDTDYFGSRSQQAMINFRVRDLDAMLAQLRAKGADVAAETQDMDGVGRFGWVTDPEGNRIELWQPA